MSITGVNLIDRLALSLRYRVAFLQLSRKSGVVVKCSKERRYSSSSSSSFPVRYVPKKTTHTDNSKVTPPPGRSSNSISKKKIENSSSYGPEKSSHSRFDKHETSEHMRKTDEITGSNQKDDVGDPKLWRYFSTGVKQPDLSDKLNGCVGIGNSEVLEEIRDAVKDKISDSVGADTSKFSEGNKDVLKNNLITSSGKEDKTGTATRGSYCSTHENLVATETGDLRPPKSIGNSPVDVKRGTEISDVSQEISGHPGVARAKFMEEWINVVREDRSQNRLQRDNSSFTRDLDGRMTLKKRNDSSREKRLNYMPRFKYVKPGLHGQIGHGLKNLNKDTDHHVVLADTGFVEEPEENIDELAASDHSEECSSPAYRKTKQEVENMVVRFLAKRAFTVVELRKKLIAKQFSVDVIDNVIQDFQKRGLVNDRLYAETYAQSRWSSSRWGPKKIKQELGMKGVSRGDVTRAVKLIFEDEESGDQSTMISNSSLEQLYTQVSKKWLQSQNVPADTRKQRIVRWLQYRGFSWDVVSTILKKLESQQSP